MEYTTNLNLKKPEQDDFYNIENENDNMDKIDTEIVKKADKTEVLTKTNTTAFTPTADYQPATKKYVDDNKTQIADNLTTEDSGKVLSAKQGKILNNNKVDKVSGKGLSTNDYTNAEKAEVAKIKDKVDKVSGKGLSANDYTDSDKAEVAKVKDKVDKVSGKGLSANDFTAAYKTKLDNLDTNLNNKVDKVSGKGLSTNDFTSTYKTKLDNLDSSLSAKAPAYSYSTTDLTAGTSALATGKLYFVYE